MPIPKEILSVERPRNTIVRATRKDGVFMVIERKGCRYDRGRRLPVN